MYKISEVASLDIDTDFEFDFAEHTAKSNNVKNNII